MRICRGSENRNNRPVNPAMHRYYSKERKWNIEPPARHHSFTRGGFEPRFRSNAKSAKRSAINRKNNSLILRRPNRYNRYNPLRHFGHKIIVKIRHLILSVIGLPALFFIFEPNFPSADGKCYIAPVKEEFSRSSAVFLGDVIREEKNGDIRTFEVRVERYWKGKDSKTISFDVHENTRYQAWFKKNGRYLIYATAGDDGRLRVGRCSRSREIEKAADDIAKLGKGKIPR